MCNIKKRSFPLDRYGCSYVDPRFFFFLSLDVCCLGNNACVCSSVWRKCIQKKNRIPWSIWMQLRRSLFLFFSVCKCMWSVVCRIIAHSSIVVFVLAFVRAYTCCGLPNVEESWTVYKSKNDRYGCIYVDRFLGNHRPSLSLSQFACYTKCACPPQRPKQSATIDSYTK